jgi:hypothetical protein
MKAFRILLTLAILFAAFGFAVKPASAQVFPVYVTGTQVMNVGTATANITITYYDALGNIVGTSLPGEQILSFQSKTYFPPASGSAVISSDQPLAAVTNILNSPSSPTASASYVGASAGSTSVGLPLLFKNNSGFYTWFTVQNAGSTDATVNVAYTDCTTNPAAVVIKPGAASTFYQQNEACHTSAVFAGQVTSSQPVVAVVVEERATPTSFMFAYSGFAKGSLAPVMPLMNANNSGITTGVQIQNLHASTASTVTVTYSPSSAGTACTETQIIPAGQSKTFALFAFNSGPYTSDPVKGTTTCAGAVKFVGSAIVTGNTGSVPLVAVVNQQAAKFGEAYDAFDSADATGTVVMPLIFDRHVNYWTGFSVMNLGAAATNIKCTFAGNKATTYEAKSGVGGVLQNAALVDQQLNKLALDFVGSATCKAYSDAAFTTYDPNAKLVGVVNELGVLTSDNMLVYEGINIP